MDTKNVIAAISLSAAVLILYSLFFAPAPDPNKIKKDPIEKTKTVVFPTVSTGEFSIISGQCSPILS